jgi:hypothetical protein
MTLEEFFQTVGPFVVGRTPHADAVRALYPGAEPRGAAADRLRIYARTYQRKNLATTDRMLARCREAVLRSVNLHAWQDLVLAYFAQHPQRHFTQALCFDHVADFLLDYAPRAGLPAWLSELADLEVWTRYTSRAPDSPDDSPPDAGPLRVGSTVRLRNHRYDVVSWLDEGDDRCDAPAARRTVVMFWRDRRLDVHRVSIGRMEVSILRGVWRGGNVDAVVRETAERCGAPEGETRQLLQSLREDSVLLGAPIAE